MADMNRRPLIAVVTLNQQVTAPTAPIVALAGAGAGNVDNGAHRVKVTFVTAVGETAAGTQSSVVTVVDKTVNGKVAISAIPVSTDPLVTGRKVYMSDVAATGFFLLSNGTIANNTATTLTANDSDATLVAATAAPATNTTTKASLLSDLLTAAGFPAILVFFQLILSPVSGTAVLSTNANIAAEADGFPLDNSANFYKAGGGDFVSALGQYLFSATPNQKVAVYARPIF